MTATPLLINSGNITTNLSLTTGSFHAATIASPTYLTIRDTDFQARNIQINSPSGAKILTISTDGEVEWFGKPSQAADTLCSIFINHVDAKIAEPVYRQRTYVRAAKSILHQVKSLESREEIIDFLTDIVDRREAVVLENLLNRE